MLSSALPQCEGLDVSQCKVTTWMNFRISMVVPP